MCFFEALPFAFGDDGVEGADNGCNGFEIFAEGTRDFRGRVIVAERAAQFEGSGVRAGQFFDSLVESAAIRGDIFAESDEDVAEQDGEARDGLGINFAELMVVFKIMYEVDTEFL